ncbi:MAG: hypothetical protein OXB99_04490 [Acidimicrobiaceae bacterium]|nr:hypothetical protein [Acidimicrobiaceae bacterium]
MSRLTALGVVAPKPVRVLGENPPCVAFDAAAARYRVLAGNYFGDGPEIFDGD